MRSPRSQGSKALEIQLGLAAFRDGTQVTFRSLGLSDTFEGYRSARALASLSQEPQNISFPKDNATPVTLTKHWRTGRWNCPSEQLKRLCHPASARQQL
jgi:hypothetical protein